MAFLASSVINSNSLTAPLSHIGGIRKAGAKGRRRRGFTLIELVVVLSQLAATP